MRVLGLTLLAGMASASSMHHLLARQSTFVPPSGCQDTCSTTTPLVNGCIGGNSTACTGICTQSAFNAFVSCFQCTVNVNLDTAAQVATLQSDINAIQGVCAEYGLNVTEVGLVVPSTSTSTVSTTTSRPASTTTPPITTTTPTAPPTPSVNSGGGSSTSSSGGLSTGAIAGIAVGAAVLLIGGLLAWFLIRRRKRQQQTTAARTMPFDAPGPGPNAGYNAPQMSEIESKVVPLPPPTQQQYAQPDLGYQQYNPNAYQQSYPQSSSGQSYPAQGYPVQGQYAQAEQMTSPASSQSATSEPRLSAKYMEAFGNHGSSIGGSSSSAPPIPAHPHAGGSSGPVLGGPIQEAQAPAPPAYS